MAKVSIKALNTKRGAKGPVTYSYRIYPPSGAHKGFRIFKRYKPSGRLEIIKNPKLELLNKSLAIKQISVEEAKPQVENIRKELYALDGIVKPEKFLSRENGLLLERYWNATYTNSSLVDAQSAKLELRRSLEALGTLELAKAKQTDLQAHLDNVLTGNKHARVVNKLNSMLKFLNRKFILRAQPKAHKGIKFITLADLPALLEHIHDERIRTLHEVCFYTGCLRSEATSLDQRSYSIDRDSIRIISQVDKRGAKKTATKTRTTVVLPEGREAIIRWFATRGHLSLDKQLKASVYTRKASHAAFPKNPSKQITFNDLRHSYAIHLLSQGVQLGLVADCLGINHRSAKELYGEFDLSNDSISYITRVLRSKGSQIDTHERTVSLTTEALVAEQMSDKDKLDE